MSLSSTLDVVSNVCDCAWVRSCFPLCLAPWAEFADDRLMQGCSIVIALRLGSPIVRPDVAKPTLSSGTAVPPLSLQVADNSAAHVSRPQSSLIPLSLSLPSLRYNSNIR